MLDKRKPLGFLSLIKALQLRKRSNRKEEGREAPSKMGVL
jgi:hypothetical protein